MIDRKFGGQLNLTIKYLCTQKCMFIKVVFILKVLSLIIYFNCQKFPLYGSFLYLGGI